MSARGHAPWKKKKPPPPPPYSAFIDSQAAPCRPIIVTDRRPHRMANGLQKIEEGARPQ